MMRMRVADRQASTGGAPSALKRSASALIFVGLLLSALATEFIGIHAIFGAFLFG